jgi:hypothetical protein
VIGSGAGGTNSGAGGPNCGAGGWQVQLISLNVGGSASAGAAAPIPMTTAIAPVTRAFVTKVVLLLVITSRYSLRPLLACGVSRLSPVLGMARAVRADARADEVSGMERVEVADVHHVLRDLLRGLAVIKF